MNMLWTAIVVGLLGSLIVAYVSARFAYHGATGPDPACPVCDGRGRIEELIPTTELTDRELAEKLVNGGNWVRYRICTTCDGEGVIWVDTEA